MRQRFVCLAISMFMLIALSAGVGWARPGYTGNTQLTLTKTSQSAFSTADPDKDVNARVTISGTGVDENGNPNTGTVTIVALDGGGATPQSFQLPDGGLYFKDVVLNLPDAKGIFHFKATTTKRDGTVVDSNTVACSASDMWLVRATFKNNSRDQLFPLYNVTGLATEGLPGDEITAPEIIVNGPNGLEQKPVMYAWRAMFNVIKISPVVGIDPAPVQDLYCNYEITAYQGNPAAPRDTYRLTGALHFPANWTSNDTGCSDAVADHAVNPVFDNTTLQTDWVVRAGQGSVSLGTYNNPFYVIRGFPTVLNHANYTLPRVNRITTTCLGVGDDGTLGMADTATRLLWEEFFTRSGGAPFFWSNYYEVERPINPDIQFQPIPGTNFNEWWWMVERSYRKAQPQDIVNSFDHICRAAGIFEGLTHVRISALASPHPNGFCSDGPGDSRVCTIGSNGHTANLGNTHGLYNGVEDIGVQIPRWEDERILALPELNDYTNRTTYHDIPTFRYNNKIYVPMYRTPFLAKDFAYLSMVERTHWIYATTFNVHWYHYRVCDPAAAQDPGPGPVDEWVNNTIYYNPNLQ